VSYQIASKRGNREQFVKMVDACHAAGVKVIADAVLNHMAGTDSGVGTAGTGRPIPPYIQTGFKH
jgi:1,4-alpha-glucan branching enzyme